MSKPILYGSPFCGPCGTTKTYLDSVDFEYEYVNVMELSENPAGLRSVPSMVLADGTMLVGDQIKTYVEGQQ